MREGILRKTATAVTSKAVDAAERYGWAFTVVSALPPIGLFTLTWGWQFAVAYVSSACLHEAAHCVEARRRGLAAVVPIMTPYGTGFCEFELSAPMDDARVGLAGPLADAVATAAVFGLYRLTHSEALLCAVALRSGLVARNLLPIRVVTDGALIVAAWRFWDGPVAIAVASRVRLAVIHLTLLCGGIFTAVVTYDVPIVIRTLVHPITAIVWPAFDDLLMTRTANRG